LGARLGEFVKSAPGHSKPKLEVVGYSAGGGDGVLQNSGPYSYPIYALKFGDPKDDPQYKKHRILVEANIHGNELAGNEAILEVVGRLIQKENWGQSDAEKILDNCIIWFLPMLNPDGAHWNEQDGNQRVSRRQNYQPWNPVAYGLPAGTLAYGGYSANARGYDINRDYWYDLSVVDANGNLNLAWLTDPALGFPKGVDGTNQFGYFLTPEARAWAKVFNELKPEFLIALHHQGSTVVNKRETSEPGVYEADLVQIALLGQAILNTGGSDGLGNIITPYRMPLNNPHYSQYSTLDMGQKVVLNAVDKVRDFPGVFARYTQNSTAQSPSCSQGVAGVNGCGIMLMEARLQGTTKGLWTQAEIIADVCWATFLAYADKSIYDIDIGPTDSWDMGANYNAIPVQQSVRAPSTTTTTTPSGPQVIKVKNTTMKQWNIVVKDEFGNEVQTGLIKNGQTWTSSTLAPGWYIVRATEKQGALIHTAGFNMPDCAGDTVLEIKFY
jgi:hypothetical protein